MSLFRLQSSVLICWRSLRRWEAATMRFGATSAATGGSRDVSATSMRFPEGPSGLYAYRFQIFIAGTAKWWTNVKAAFRRFTDITNDGDDEGAHVIFRLPRAEEAEIIRHYVGVAKKAVYSDEVLGRKRDQALMARRLIGQKPAKTASGGITLPIGTVCGF